MSVSIRVPEIVTKPTHLISQIYRKQFLKFLLAPQVIVSSNNHFVAEPKTKKDQLKFSLVNALVRKVETPDFIRLLQFLRKKVKYCS